jgi:hypothetical protein
MLTAGATRLLTELKVGAERPMLTPGPAMNKNWGGSMATSAEALTVASSKRVAVTVSVGGEGTVAGAV